MTQVFISYSRRDLAFVEQLASDLKEVGLDVWYDLSGLEGGSRWRKGIEDAIRASQHVIVILSPDSVASEWVEREYLFASNLGKKVIPLFFRQCELPLNYLTLHYVDVQGENYERNYKEILRALGLKRVGREKPSGASEVLPTPAAPKDMQKKMPASVPEKAQTVRKKWMRIIFGIIPVAFVIVIGVVWNSLQEGNWLVPTQISPVVHVITLTPSPRLTPTITQTPEPLDAIITDQKGIPMILIQAGEYMMGIDVDVALDECRKYDTNCLPTEFLDEEPARLYYLDSFYIDKYEVSNANYQECVAEGVCSEPEDFSSGTRSSYYDFPGYANYPVVHVTWDMANDYCKWRDTLLPTEEQWEKAARGADARMYPWGNDFDGTQANFCDRRCRFDWANPNFDDGINDTAPVDSYENGISPEGVYNLSGNVWEWVNGWYYAASPTYENGTSLIKFAASAVPPEFRLHLLRGGSWESRARFLRATERYGSEFLEDDSFGFRCAKDAAS